MLRVRSTSLPQPATLFPSADGARVLLLRDGDRVNITATRGGTAMAHVPQMYSLYELYLAAAHALRGRAVERIVVG